MIHCVHWHLLLTCVNQPSKCRHVPQFNLGEWSLGPARVYLRDMYLTAQGMCFVYKFWFDMCMIWHYTCVFTTCESTTKGRLISLYCCSGSSKFCRRAKIRCNYMARIPSFICGRELIGVYLYNSFLSYNELLAKDNNIWVEWQWLT